MGMGNPPSILEVVSVAVTVLGLAVAVMTPVMQSRWGISDRIADVLLLVGLALMCVPVWLLWNVSRWTAVVFGLVPMLTMAFIGHKVLPWHEWRLVISDVRPRWPLYRASRVALAPLPEPPVSAPTPKPPIVRVLHPESSVPVGLLPREHFDGIKVRAEMHGHDVVMIVTNHNQAGLFACYFEVSRLQGRIHTVGEESTCLPWCLATGELATPGAAREVYPYCGLGFRHTGRVRVAYREKDIGSNVFLYSYAEIGGEQCMSRYLELNSNYDIPSHINDVPLCADIQVSIWRMEQRAHGMSTAKCEWRGVYSMQANLAADGLDLSVAGEAVIVTPTLGDSPTKLEATVDDASAADEQL